MHCYRNSILKWYSYSYLTDTSHFVPSFIVGIRGGGGDKLILFLLDPLTPSIAKFGVEFPKGADTKTFKHVKIVVEKWKNKKLFYTIEQFLHDNMDDLVF